MPCAAPTTQETSVALDDVRFMRRLHTEAERLHESGQTVKLAELVKQLGRDRCTVALSSPRRAPISSEELYAQAKQSVLAFGALYKCDKCTNWHISSASGFVLSASGVAVTNYHVVDDAKKEALVAMTADGRVLPVKAVLAASKADDVAIVQLDADNLTPLPLGGEAAVGSHVRVISHPDGRFYTLTEGIVSRHYLRQRPGGGGAPRMSITADYAKGSSGAPLFDSRGNVVGLVSSTSSIYYNERDGHKENLQMVIKECIPAASVAKLIRP